MRKFLILFALLVMAFPVFAQDSTPEVTPEATMQPATGGDPNTAYVRFAQFAPGAGALSLTFDQDATVFENVDYGTITDWMAFPAGDYNATVSAAGSDAQGSIQPTELNLAGQSFSTIAAVPAQDGSLKLEVIDETFPEMIPGTAYVTFVNAVPNGAAVDLVRDDVVYVPALASLGNADGVTSWTGIRDDAGTFNMKFAESGTTDSKVVADLPDTKITEGDLYLIALVPSADGSGAQAIVNQTPMSRIYLLEGRMQEPGTIMDTLRADETLAPFADALDKAGLSETLNGEGPYTLFVPAGFLMDNIPADVMNDPNALKTWLQNYIVEGDLKSRDMANTEGPLTTLGGQTLTPETREDGIYVNGKQIIVVNVPATNGTIHVINGLLGENSQ